MGIAEEYSKKVKTPLIKVMIIIPSGLPGVDSWGEVWYPEVIGCSISNGFDQGSATCSLKIKPPYFNGVLARLDPMSRVIVQQGWNTPSTYKVTFNGFISSIDYANAPESYTVECRDILKLAQDNYYIDSNKLVYSATPDPSELNEFGQAMGGQSIELRQAQVILRDIFEGCGIPSRYLNLDFEEYPASGAIIIGQYATAVFEYESAFDAATRICDLIGYRVWADKSGIVQCRECRPVAGEAAAQDYYSQTDSYDGFGNWTTVVPGNILAVDANISDDLRNWVTVKGYGDVSSTVSGPSDYVPTPPTYRRVELQSYLIDTEELAQAIAERVYEDLNRLRYTANVTIEGDPRIEIGQTIGIYDNYATGGVNYFLYDYTSTLERGNWTMTLGLVGGLGEGSAPISNVSPVAVFTHTVEREKLSDGSTIYEVTVDASSSYDPDGELIPASSYLWTVAGFDDRTDVKTTYVVPSGASPLTVTLSVIDDGIPQLTDTISRSIILSENVYYRAIYAVTSSAVWYTTTGGDTWSSKEIY